MKPDYKMKAIEDEISDKESSVFEESEGDSESSKSIGSPMNKKTNTFKSYITDSNNKKSERNIIQFFDTQNDDLSFISEAEVEKHEPSTQKKSKKKIKKKLKFPPKSTSKKIVEENFQLPLLKSQSARKKSPNQFEF